MNNMNIQFNDLVVAYRKAKVDAFYENGHLTSVDFANYEHNLLTNLSELFQKINSEDFEWFGGKDFVGGHMFALKKINFKGQREARNKPFVYYSNSDRNWNSKVIDNIDYRILGRHSIHFHVLSSLWLEKVGYKLEQFVSENSYGCRLRSVYIGGGDKRGEERYLRGRFGHFKSYLPAYQSWQRNGLNEISKSFISNKKIIAVTADLKKFYHRINPSFIIEEDFLKYLGTSLDRLQLNLSKLLIHAIKIWSRNVYNDKELPKEFRYREHCGVPMGLGASKTIANLLLIYLDREIEKEIKPIYYGRYVDDLFLVIEDGKSNQDSSEFWYYLKKRIKGLKKSRKRKINEHEYAPDGWILDLPYAPNCLIEFSKDKEKFFFLEGIGGESFMNTLKESLEENSSEWNMPPDIDKDIESFTEEVSKATTENMESANGLRKSDGLSIQRLKFILYLKRLEIVVSFIPKQRWESNVISFFDLCLEHAVTPETIAIYTKYYPRIISLALKIKEYKFIETFVQKIKQAFIKMNDSVSLVYSPPLARSREYIFLLLHESILTTIDPEEFGEVNKRMAKLFIEISEGTKLVSQDVIRLINCDLHKKPYKDYFVYPSEKMPDFLNIHNLELWNKHYFDSDNLPNYTQFEKFSKEILNKVYKSEDASYFRPFSFYFFTRPLSLFDLSLVFPQWYSEINKSQFSQYCKLFGIDFSDNAACTPGTKLPGDIIPVCVNSGNISLDRTVAFTSLETKYESWVAVVQEHLAEPDDSRVQRIFTLIDDILRTTKRKKIDYVLFPELSIPKHLLNYISNLFLKKRISVIAGVEYADTTKTFYDLPRELNRYVTNKLYFILTYKGNWGFSHIVLQQEKLIPAQKEERDLFDIGGAVLRPINSDKYLINHSGFWLAGLICNDFLDISNRASLRGLIDALIIVEWNMDIKTYDSLVESSANDLHTFVIQVNNRIYGDTRLRGPYKEDYQRDVVRVRGGELDYFVVATLDVDRLRLFQRQHRSPEKPFKPTPTGFNMSPARRNG